MSIALAAPVLRDTGTWSLGTKLGLPIACVGALILLVAVIVCVWWELVAADSFDEGLGWMSGGFAFLCLAGLVIGCLFGYYPYGKDYHFYRDVSGTVENVSDRFIASGVDGSGSSQRFVVTFQGSGQQFGIDDTRASLVKPDDTISLRCIREHDSGSNNDGYACKWGQS